MKWNTHLKQQDSKMANCNIRDGMQNATQFEKNLFFNYKLLSSNGISPFFALSFG